LPYEVFSTSYEKLAGSNPAPFTNGAGSSFHC
jgi:hypothetical protein